MKDDVGKYAIYIHVRMYIYIYTDISLILFEMFDSLVIWAFGSPPATGGTTETALRA